MKHQCLWICIVRLRFNKWVTKTYYPNNFAFSSFLRVNTTAIKFLLNSMAVLYSRLRGFGLLCFLRDIFTTHNTNTCQHCSRGTSTILHNAEHTSAPHSALRATEAHNSCGTGARQRTSLARDPTNTTLNFGISSKLSTISNQFHATKSLRSYSDTQEITTVYGTQKFISMFNTEACLWLLSWARCIQTTPPTLFLKE